ncbi:MAG: hypothetical protein Q4G49_06770, partial [Paracoccus sp. (in: a-proteobacteria)]|nr:hypothetical protein [Paracoccus sp. (in: a-proteobacteria)]
MDACTWVDQSPAREIATGSAATAGRQVAVTQRSAMTEHPGGTYAAAPPADAVWSAPATARFFCSMARPAFQDADGAWIVLPLP